MLLSRMRCGGGDKGVPISKLQYKLLLLMAQMHHKLLLLMAAEQMQTDYSQCCKLLLLLATRVETCKCRLTNASAADYLSIYANVRSVLLQTN